MSKSSSVLYIDMDDTLFDTKKLIVKLLGSEDSYPTRQDLWTTLALRYPRFFMDIPPFVGYKEFLKSCKNWCDNHDYDMQLLTAVPVHAPSKIFMHDKIYCAAKYIQPVLGYDIKVNFGPFSKDKQSWVNNTSINGRPDILIDNSAINIRQWDSVGGCGIIHSDFKTSLQSLQNASIKRL